MPLARSFTMRHGLPSGPDGEERPIASNFPNGVGRKENLIKIPKNPDGSYATGLSTPSAPAVPTTSAPQSVMKRAPNLSVTDAAVDPQYQQPTSPGQQRAIQEERSARMARIGTPNAGGTATLGGVTRSYAPSRGAGLPSDRANSGGTMTRGGVTTTVPASGVAALATPSGPEASPTTSGAAQTESHNPLSGDGNFEANDTTETIDPARSLGLSARGAGVPQGQDALPGSISGGSGLYARKFGNKGAADIYSKYVKRLFPA